MAYNIHHCRGMDDVVDVERIARVIRDANPDLVSLQEVDVRVERSNGVDQLAELARLTGMHGKFGKAIDYGGGDYGQAILSRWPIESFEVHELPGAEAEEQRIAVMAMIAPEGNRPPIRFVGTHLHHRSEEHRLSQTRRLLEILRNTPMAATIVTGDLNAQPDSATVQLFLADFEDTSLDGALTFPAATPRSRIDYILIAKGSPWRATNNVVPDEPVASDHRPLFADLEWSPMAP
jgi:endonuclease/exonuclease/phosphatase family metal-dependent hydrolase